MTSLVMFPGEFTARVGQEATSHKVCTTQHTFLQGPHLATLVRMDFGGQNSVF